MTFRISDITFSLQGMDVTLMDIADFYEFENGLSQSQVSKHSRPLLSEVVSIQFSCKGGV